MNPLRRDHRPRFVLALAVALPSVIWSCVDDATTPHGTFDLPEAGTLDATVDRDASGTTASGDAGLEDATVDDATLADVTTGDATTADADDAAGDAAGDDANGDDAADAADGSDDADAGDFDAADASDAADGDDAGDAATSLPDGGVTSIDPVRDDDGTVVNVEQGPIGPPLVIGCADGQREGLVDHLAHPTMAGCLGVWGGAMDLRAARSGTPCGDDIALADGGAIDCVAPGDLCATGWHLCGATGAVSEVAALGPTECESAGGARYVTAISHCQTQSGCEYDAGGDYSCFATGWCSEPVCCGQRCLSFGVCTGGVWAGATHIPVGTDQGCGAITARRAGGVLCCKD